MAIYHLSMKPIARSAGRSAVAAAAYRAGEVLVNERDGQQHDFTRRQGVEHAEIVLPLGIANATWAKDRSALWNAAEKAEQRKDARVAREIEVALPHELNPEERLALVRSFCRSLAERFGVAVDFAIHSPHAPTDERNHHAHLMLTTRRIEKDGLGEKSILEWENKKLQAQGLPTTHEQLRLLRIDWEQQANRQLARAGLDIRVDHRSHAARGLAIEPTQHMGVHATQMERRGKDVSRVRLESEASLRNAEAIRAHPEQVLSLITNEKSVFDRHDVARALHRAIDEPQAFQAAMARVMASNALVELQPERREADGSMEPARYSTREMVAIERGMAESADRLLGGRGAGVARRHIAMAMEARPHLSAEQREAVAHITGDECIAAVAGLAGAGKSTMLAAARQAWEAGGFKVHGAALAGKAAEGLEESAGIASRTLASWQMSWERGFDKLGEKDIFVVDEAGMVGSRQLARFIAEADKVGAKLVLVGDPEQLQPIGAGAAFRAVAERCGFASLEGVRRQSEDWQRAASKDFGQFRTAEGLAAYQGHGAIRLEESGEAARAAIVREVLADRQAKPESSRLVLAHRRVDVEALNGEIRQARRARGELAGEIEYQTSEGRRAFAPGDRVLFRQNDRALGVKNGMLGTLERAEEGRLEVRLDSAKGEGQGRGVEVEIANYGAIDHGYATTIHKAQGATVDKAWVLASSSMDRHLAYVAMTRHREGVRLYAGRDEFESVAELSQRLSRGGAKETTLDYDRARYAERRGLELQSDIVALREPEKAQAAQVALKGRFDGLRLNARPLETQGERAQKAPEAPGQARDIFAGLKLPRAPAHEAAAPARDKSHKARGGKGELARSIDSFLLAVGEAHRMRAQALPILAHQEAALRSASRALDKAQPNAARDLWAAIEADPQMLKAAREPPGEGRSARLIEGMNRQAYERLRQATDQVFGRAGPAQQPQQRQIQQQEAQPQSPERVQPPSLARGLEPPEPERDRGFSR
jgi:Ti-type conjugative transfer relaxase TraA